jgi:hypothetical protein
MRVRTSIAGTGSSYPPSVWICANYPAHNQLSSDNEAMNLENNSPCELTRRLP